MTRTPLIFISLIVSACGEEHGLSQPQNDPAALNEFYDGVASSIPAAGGQQQQKQAPEWNADDVQAAIKAQAPQLRHAPIDEAGAAYPTEKFNRDLHQIEQERRIEELELRVRSQQRR